MHIISVEVHDDGEQVLPPISILFCSDPVWIKCCPLNFITMAVVGHLFKWLYRP